MNVRLVTYDRSFLDHSWTWLNDSEIKKLTDTTDFTRETQKRWYDSLPSRNDYKIWGVMADKTSIGVCGLKKITREDCEYWGYIGEKDYWGKGIGRIITELMEKEARGLYLKSIWLQVLRENERAIRLYVKLGYIVESQGQELIFMRKYL